ncbi:MAG: T9SS type A sorting domain-containing protein [Bacteroidales bacterium]|nr:T9SS type A sorting domain-containing protein [Bacteroidales bacterium]
MIRKLFLAMALLVGAAHCHGQTTVATAGGEAGTLSFTVGQVIYTATTGEAGSLTAGVHQAYDISTVALGAVGLANGISLNAYPNPVADRLTLVVADASAVADLGYTLTDAAGRTLTTDRITAAKVTIDMTAFAPAVYFLRVDEGTTLVRTFKIVKK